IFGKMGSNKTHFATFYALFLANKLHKKVVLNYLLHPDNLMAYCIKMGYQWLVQRLTESEPVIYYCDVENGGLDYILSIEDSVVAFDEVALYVPSRGSGSVTTKSSKFHKDLTQIRHRHNYLLVIAQNHQQIDSAIRNLAEETFHCAGLTLYDEQLKSQKLWFKIVNRFVPDNYELWVSNPRLRRNPIKTKLMANKSFSGMLKLSDVELFSVYQSFGLVHEIELKDAFPDSWVTYYKEPVDVKKTFSWAYIQTFPEVPDHPNRIQIWAYTKLPAVYFLIWREIKRLYLPTTFVLYSPGSNLLLSNIVICLLSLLALLVLLLFIKSFWLMFVLFCSLLLCLRQRLRQTVR
ncbi:P-loop NTPase family protein, partial [Nostoc sp.]